MTSARFSLLVVVACVLIASVPWVLLGSAPLSRGVRPGLDPDRKVGIGNQETSKDGTDAEQGPATRIAVRGQETPLASGPQETARDERAIYGEYINHLKNSPLKGVMPIVVPSSTEQREDFILHAFDLRADHIRQECWDRKEVELKRLPNGLSTDDIAIARDLLHRAMDLQFGYSLELDEAIKEHIRTSSDLSKNGAISLTEAACAGSMVIAVQGSPWPQAPALAEAHFHVDFASSERLNQSNLALYRARQAYESFLVGLDEKQERKKR